MQVREARKGDWGSIVALIATYPETLVQDRLPEWSSFFVAEEDSLIVGCIALDIYSQRMAEIRSLAVLSQYGYAEVASLLVDKCVEQAEVSEVKQILSVTEDEQLFLSKGFGAHHGEKLALFRIINGGGLSSKESGLITPPGNLEVIIIRATEQDSPKINQLIQEYPDRLVQDPTLLPSIDSFFVAKHGQRVVGCVALDIYSGKLTELRTFAVAPDCGGRGIGSHLIVTCLQEAYSRGVYEVLAITSKAAPLFKRFGFEASHGSVYAMWKVLTRKG